MRRAFFVLGTASGNTTSEKPLLGMVPPDVCGDVMWPSAALRLACADIRGVVEKKALLPFSVERGEREGEKAQAISISRPNDNDECVYMSFRSPPLCTLSSPSQLRMTCD